MILGVLQARVSSTRLPGKVMLPVLGEPMIARQIERVRRATLLDGLVVATSTDASDDPLAELCVRLGVDCYRGSLEDVLVRFVGAARSHGADHVVRLTGDCPLADPGVIDAVIGLHLEGGFDYTSNTAPPTFPDGMDVEVMRVGVLERADREARAGSEREHVTQYIVKHPETFALGTLVNDVDLSQMRWTVDEPEDLEFVREVYAALYPLKPSFSWRDVLAFVVENPGVCDANAGIVRNEGLMRSESEDRRGRESGGVEDV